MRLSIMLNDILRVWLMSLIFRHSDDSEVLEMGMKIESITIWEILPDW